MSRRPLDPLPIDAILGELVNAFRGATGGVLVAPPGAGKTTRVPPALDAAGFGPVVILEPRRIAARAAARRVAHETGATLGREVGYHVRFDRRAKRDTRLLFVTEGVLLRRLQDDPFLEGVGCVVFDEFHERRLDSDLALAMVRRAQLEVRPELRVLVTSATLEARPVAEFLGDAPIVESEGRLYPVDLRHVPALGRERMEEHLVRAVGGALEDTTGDLLVFLPGVGEIKRAARALAGTARGAGLELQELYGELSPERQDAALSPGARRRIVLSTNVAESSVTVAGVRTVVDLGMARVLRHDTSVGLDRLAVERIDRAAADQRAGRAGREGPGVCVRLWSAIDDRTLAARLEPEVRRLDLAGPVLELAAWGELDPAAFPWFEQPGTDALDRARELLVRLDALDDAGRPTELGRMLRRLPLHPRLARLAVEGARLGAPERAATAAAMLAERDPLRQDWDRPPRDASDSDVLDRVRALEEFEASGRTTFPIGELARGGAQHVLRARDQLLRTLGDLGAPTGDGHEDGDALARALLAAFPDRLARRREGDARRAVMVGGRGLRLAPSCSVTEDELFVAVDVQAGRGEGLVRMASGVERAWVDGGRTHVVRTAVFDPASERVVGRRQVRLGELALEEEEHPLDDPAEGERILAEAARADPSRALGLDQEPAAGFLARLRSLREWRPELELPALDEPELAELLPYLVVGRRSFAELRKAPVVDAIRGTLTHQQRTALDREAPERIRVPTGNQLRLTYEPGRPPVLAVRIQELFGLRESPTVAGGRVRVLLHLLAPNGRPQQVTDDLASFWANAYHVVRKDLRIRYAKHAWPEDPLAARPESRPRRRKG